MMWNLCNHYAVSVLGIFCILRFVLAATPLCSQELQWKVLGHLKQPRMQFGIGVIGEGRVLVVGGFAGLQGIQSERLRGAMTAECEIIDVASHSITSAPPMNVPHAQSVVLQTADSNVVVISGLNTDSTTTPICEMFDRKKMSGVFLVPYLSGGIIIWQHLSIRRK